MDSLSSHRRAFLSKAVRAGAAAIAAPYFVTPSALGLCGRPPASDRIVIGAIGCGGKGRHNTGVFLAEKDTQIVAVCDVDSGHAEQDQRQVDQHYGTSDCRRYADFREIVARGDIDAVHVSTPDHWHALISVAAIESGKDVYCEKPLANSVSEAIAIRDAARRRQRVVQTGSQERSNDKVRFACELVRSGRVGKLHTVEVNMPCGDEAHHKEVIAWKGIPDPQPVPANLDWDFWLGPRPLAPYHERRSHFWWRFILAYGGGEMTDRGAHIIDLAQLANASDESGPSEITARGTRNAGSLYDAFMDYEFENVYSSGVRMVGRNREPRGLKLIGEDGWVFIHIHGGDLKSEPADLLEIPLDQLRVRLGRSPGHHRNFLDCVKDRQLPVAHAEIGCRTATICHLNNIAMLLGRTIRWDPVGEQIVDDDEAAALLRPSFREPWRLM
jgi:predicted dehydrogenase